MMNSPRETLSLLAAEIIAAGLVGCGSEYTSRAGARGPTASAPPSSVHINEFMPYNRTAAVDASGDPDDWVELYNGSDEEARLEGFYLSDSGGPPFRQRLSAEVVVPAKGVVLIWADREPDEGALHMSFRLDRDGESVWLARPDGEVIDMVEFGFAPTDESFARLPDGDGPFAWCSNPTPGRPNGSGRPGIPTETKY
jgi:hypothetical protein